MFLVDFLFSYRWLYYLSTHWPAVLRAVFLIRYRFLNESQIPDVISLFFWHWKAWQTGNESRAKCRLFRNSLGKSAIHQNPLLICVI